MSIENFKLCLPKIRLNYCIRRSFRLKSDLAALFYDALKEARKKSLPAEFSTFRGIPYRNIESVEQS